jgi:hypothetical protein
MRLGSYREKTSSFPAPAPCRGGKAKHALRRLVAFFTALALSTGPATAAAESPGQWMVELSLGGRTIEGMPLAWNPSEVHLLARDGRLWDFPPDEASQFRKTSSRFRSYSTSEFRAMLLGDLGSGFEVTGSGHYLVAHPRGQRDLWGERFEDLYRSFVQYFSVRGFELDEPLCPLIGVVCSSREDFIRYSAGQGMPAPGVLGYYDIESNRIVLYDASGGSGDSGDWRQNAAVAIHEAAHQTAFNTGIHSRFAPPPYWVAEGVATMFEAPGVYDSRYHARLADRVNPGRLAQFRQLAAAGHRPELLSELVASDRLFQVSPAAAYAESWALTFYLVETRRGKFVEYLALTAARPAFTPYTAAERTADFTAVFGDDWRMLEAQLLRFMAGLR